MPSETQSSDPTVTQSSETTVTSPRDPADLSAPSRVVSWLLALGGLIGLSAATVLLVERIELFKNADYIPTCNLNPILSCGSVMNTDQAAAFSIPNPIIGVAGFAALAAVGVALLAGARFARWFWVLVQVGVTFGVGFVHWLIWQSLYEIGALCPYCMVVWAVTIPVFWVTTLHVVGLFTGPRGWLGRLREFALPTVVGWYLVIVALIAVRFWSYWSTLV